MKRRSLASTLSFLIAAVVAIAVGVTSVLAVAASVRSLREQTLAANLAAATLVAGAVEQYVAASASVMREAPGRPKLGREIAAGNWPEAERVLQNFLRNFTRFEYVFVQDAAGVIRVRVPRAATIGQDFSFRDFFREAVRTRQLYVSGVYASRATGQQVVAIAVPVLDADRVTGVLVGALSLSTLSDFLRSIGRDAADVFVVDAAGAVVASSRPSEPRRDAGADRIVRAALGPRPGVLEYSEAGSGDRMLGAHAPVGSLGWGVVAAKPLSLAYAATTSLARWLVAIAVVGIVAGVVLGVLLARRLTRPLLRFVDLTEHLAAGDLSVRVTPGPGDELAVLARSFNHMAERLERSYGALEQKSREVAALNVTLEQRVVERTRQLEAANRELEAFTYTVSHDLKAPLRGMAGFARAVQEDYADRLDDTGRRQLATIQSSAGRMGALIDDLLRYSRLERRDLRRDRVELRPLLQQILDEVGDEVRARSLQVRVDLAVAAVDGEREGLREALANLVGNAVKFSPEAGGTVTITSRREGPDVVVSVADTGVGFDMKYHDRIFRIFERLHRQEEYAGTGVGLAIVKKVAERHGGRAWAVSEIGQGSTFHLALPATGEEPS